VEEGEGREEAEEDNEGVDAEAVAEGRGERFNEEIGKEAERD